MPDPAPGHVHFRVTCPHCARQLAACPCAPADCAQVEPCAECRRKIARGDLPRPPLSL